MAVDARVMHEDRLALCCRGIAGKVLLRGLLLLAYPRRKVFRRLRIDAQQHLCMLGPAVLRALAKIKACLRWIDPHGVNAIWNHVRLARQPRHPETMVRIRRRHRKISWRWLRRLTDGNMQLIRRHHPQLWIAVLPPELVANHGYVHRAVRL